MNVDFPESDENMEIEFVFYICLPCIFDRKYKSDAANDYIRLRSSEFSYVCTQCSNPFRLGYKLYTATVIQEQKFSCIFAGKVSSSARSLENRGYFYTKDSSDISHLFWEYPMQSHREEITFNYNVCIKGFKQKHGLKIHSNTDINDQLPSVKGFTQTEDLKRHIRLQTKEIPFPCEECSKRFRDKSSLKKHLMMIHTNLKPFPCEVCNQRFAQKRYLKIHMLIHTKEQPFFCGLCNKRFSYKRSLEEHMRIHTKEKPFSCGVCNKIFRHKQSLEVHMRIHTKEKPFSCGVCNKRFRHKQSLEKHMLIHTNERPFPCEVCNKRFTQKSNLKTHMRIHTNERPVSM